MPTSAHTSVPLMLEEILRCNPKSVLDIGIGFGKYGFLCREYLEVYSNRFFPEQWKVRIDGIEIFSKYVEKFKWVKMLYNNIYIGDAYSLINNLPSYDLIIAGDVVEHFPKERGIELIKKCVKKSNKCFLTSIPLGEKWIHLKLTGENVFEKHLAYYNEEEIKKLSQELNCLLGFKKWKAIYGEGGVFSFWKK